MASADVAYAAAVLAIYLSLVIPAAYTAFKHGVQGMAWLGWGYFIVFCSLRIIGSALQISSPASTGAAIISSVGLSPLTIAVGGVLHEARFHLLSLRNHPEKNKLDLIYVLLFHTVVAAAVALLAAGASGLQQASSPETQHDPSKLNRDWTIAGVGGLVLLSTVLLVFLGAIYTYLCHKPETTTTTTTTQQQRRIAQQGLVLAVAVACPLLAIRVLGSTVFFFSKDMAMSPVSGTWGFRIGLYLVPEVMAACALLAGGLVGRNVGEEDDEKKRVLVVEESM